MSEGKTLRELVRELHVAASKYGYSMRPIEDIYKEIEPALADFEAYAVLGRKVAEMRPGEQIDRAINGFIHRKPLQRESEGRTAFDAFGVPKPPDDAGQGGA